MVLPTGGRQAEFYELFLPGMALWSSTDATSGKTRALALNHAQAAHVRIVRRNWRSLCDALPQWATRRFYPETKVVLGMVQRVFVIASFPHR
jgi:hypothetical protein